MAIEIANVVHAIATLNLANVADSALITKASGIRAAHRVSAGVYTVTPDEPLDQGAGVAIIVNGNLTSRTVSAQVALISVEGDDNILINTFTDAGVAGDIGVAYLVLLRYPTVG